MTPEESSPVIKGKSWRWLRLFVRGLVAIVLVLLILAGVAVFFGYDIAKQYVESPAGTQMAGRELGKAIKVDGAFAPLHLNRWTIQTDSFTSQGWPGEAIGNLNATNVRAEFDPSAIWHGAWRFSSIQMDRAEILLLKPEDSLKRPAPPKKPKPWYAFLLPDHFECGPMISPKSELKFYFQGIESGIHDAHVEANLIGKDLKYTVTSGVLDFPYLPPLRIELLEMLVTRPSITVYTAHLVGVDPTDTAQLLLSGRIGNRENKSIDALVDVTDMPIEKILPENLRPLIDGKVSGKLNWHRSASGEDLASDGDLKLTEASIHNLSVFIELNDLNNNPDLQSFNFDDATVHYHLQDGVISLELHARSPDKFNLTGRVIYDLKTKMADLDVKLDELSLKTWLPSDFKPRYSGYAHAALKWHGQLDTRKDSTGTLDVNFDGTHISNPVLLRNLLAKKGFRAPEDIQVNKAQFSFSYDHEVFRLTKSELISPGVIKANLMGSLDQDKNLSATMDWEGIKLTDWLPLKIAHQLSGNLDGHIALAVRQWKYGEGNYAGDVRLLNGEVHYTSVQSILARFLNERKLLDLPLTRTQLSWTWADGAAQAKGIDLRAGDDFGVKGDLNLSKTQLLSGLLWVGTKPEYLIWLPDAEQTVFTRKDEGLVWAQVKVSGTMKKPEQDLGAQVMRQLKRHPLAMAGLGVKMVSWLVGNWFGADKEWKQPEAQKLKASVEAGAVSPRPSIVVSTKKDKS